MSNALDEIVIGGIRTNIELHQDLVKDSEFKKGGVNIHYLEKKLGL
jgi:acetyl-CoA carboxylase biotin carboxylase subunit